MKKPKKMKNQKWPKDKYGHGTNEWEHDIGAFGTLLQANTDGWWCFDTKLKYLDIRVDTRDGGFIVSAEGQRISPDRVVDAIQKWRQEFGPVISVDEDQS